MHELQEEARLLESDSFDNALLGAVGLYLSEKRRRMDGWGETHIGTDTAPQLRYRPAEIEKAREGYLRALEDCQKVRRAIVEKKDYKAVAQERKVPFELVADLAARVNKNKVGKVKEMRYLWKPREAAYALAMARAGVPVSISQWKSIERAMTEYTMG